MVHRNKQRKIRNRLSIKISGEFSEYCDTVNENPRVFPNMGTFMLPASNITFLQLFDVEEIFFQIKRETRREKRLHFHYDISTYIKKMYFLR